MLGYINIRGENISPETKSRVIIFSQSVLITLTPSSKGSMFIILSSIFCPLYLLPLCNMVLNCWGRRRRDRMVVGFTTTDAFSAYHH